MNEKEVVSQLKELKKQLTGILELHMWGIRADQRLKKNGRVELSVFGRDRGFKFKGGTSTATVVGFGGTQSVKVLIDGYKQPKSFHHMFWQPTHKKAVRR